MFISVVPTTKYHRLFYKKSIYRQNYGLSKMPETIENTGFVATNIIEKNFYSPSKIWSIIISPVKIRTFFTIFYE